MGWNDEIVSNCKQVVLGMDEVYSIINAGGSENVSRRNDQGAATVFVTARAHLSRGRPKLHMENLLAAMGQQATVLLLGSLQQSWDIITGDVGNVRHLVPDAIVAGNQLLRNEIVRAGGKVCRVWGALLAPDCNQALTCFERWCGGGASLWRGW